MDQQGNSTVTTEVSPRSAGIRYGVIAGVIGVAYFLLLNTLGLDVTQGFWSWFKYAITITIIFLAHKYYKDNGDSFMSYGQGVGISFWTGLVSSVILNICTYIYIKFIDTGFIGAMKEKQMEALEKQGISDEQIDQTMQISGMFMTPEVIVILGLILGIIGTVIIGLLVSIFTQKKTPEQAF